MIGDAVLVRAILYQGNFLLSLPRPLVNGPIVDGFDILGGKPVDSVGRAEPALADHRSISNISVFDFSSDDPYYLFGLLDK